MFKEYINLDAIGLLELLQKKEVSPLEVLNSAITQIEKYNPLVNAVIYKMYEYGKNKINSIDLSNPLAGIPFLIKDLGIDIKGYPTSSGSFLTKNYIAKKNSEIFNRYERAGLITIGKTNVPEFGILAVTEPKLFGPTRNPWNLNLTSGGSSGGSAAAVASRMVPIATADDGGGSIRIPASACGLFGFKPSRGLQPMGPRKNESWLSLVSGHVVTRSVRDSALALEQTCGIGFGAAYGPTKSPTQFFKTNTNNKSLVGKKIAYTKDSLFGQNVSQHCLKALDHTLKACADAGMIAEEAKPNFNKEELLFSFYVIVVSSIAGEVSRNEKLMNTKADLSNIEYITWFLKDVGEKLRATQLETALFNARQTTILWENFFTQYDYFCTPTLAFEPSPIGLMNTSLLEKLAIRLSPLLPLPIIVSALKQMGAKSVETTPNNFIFNLSGHPAMSIPSYWTEDSIPIGTQFIGRMGEDEHLFNLAFELEQRLPWSNKIPKIIET